MVPREPRKKSRKPSARLELPAASQAITDDEWQSFYHRSVLLLPGVVDTLPPPGGGLSPRAAAASLEAETHLAETTVPTAEFVTTPEVVTDRAPTWPEREVVEEPGSRRHEPRQEPPVALSEQEWHERFFQRGQLTGLLEGDDLLILTAPDVAGGVTSLRLRGQALRSVAAAALQQDPAGFDWRDHDDLVLLGIVLDWCLRGIPLDRRPPAVRDAVWAMAERFPALLERLAALLPSR